MLLEAECWEVDTIAEHLGFGQNTDTANTVELHLYIRITKRVPQVCQVRPVRRVLGVALDNNRILVQCISQRKRRVRLLPRVEVIRLLSAKPVRQRAPDICVSKSACSPKPQLKPRVWHSLGTITSLLCLIKSSKIVNGAVSTSTSRQYTHE
jgi:hypothetical protein